MPGHFRRRPSQRSSATPNGTKLLLSLAVCVSPLIVAGTSLAAEGEQVTLVIDRPISAPVRFAVRELRRALRQKQIGVAEAKTVPATKQPVFVIGIADKSSKLDRILEDHALSLPSPAESLLLKKIRDELQQTLLVAGRDVRGLTYAILELARTIELAPTEKGWFDVIPEITESPWLRTRSITMQLFNEELDSQWYFDEDFWRSYFAMLARYRYNNFSLTFAHQTNYMNPAYPWLLKVPEYPSVRVDGLTDQARNRNLEMLRRISELAHEYAIDFTFGLWTQQPVEVYGRTYLENFPQGPKSGDYCAKALRRLLQACPAIDGVQFRMNIESGIPEDEQKAYFQAQFDAIANCGRPVRLDLRFKGLRQQTIDQAIESGVEVTVSTKFWCEHMGLPFHPTTEDRKWRESRYGYGAMLHKPRNYRVVYRLWSVGSQRLLLWGDPAYAARFAQSCTLGGGEGFEVFAPLTNKGFGNQPGRWRIFADRSYEHFRWEQERYWLFYLAFGRLGYNPNTEAECWRREFRHRFGDAAEAVEQAYRQASQIIPLLTATRLFSASEWRFWPEMNPGGPVSAYAAIQPSDYGQFYAIRPWRRVEGWMAEDWHGGHTGFVEDAIKDRVRAKWTPIQVSRELHRLADRTQHAVSAAREQLTSKDGGQADRLPNEFRATELDLGVLAQLARYHAEKLRAATHLEFFRVTADAGRLKPALVHIKKAATAWENIVRVTQGVYHDNLVFGHDEQRRPRTKQAILAHSGHWSDRRAEVRNDVDYVQKLVADHGDAGQDYREFPGERPTGELPRVVHVPVNKINAGEPLRISARVTCPQPLRRVLLHYRNLDQTDDWQHLAMKETGDGLFTATIPGEAVSARYDLMYYLEARLTGGGTLWPDWRKQQPYVVVPTIPEE